MLLCVRVLVLLFIHLKSYVYAHHHHERHIGPQYVEALHGSHVFCLSSHVRWRCVRAQRENTKRILLLFSHGNIICRHLQIFFFSGLYNLMGYTFYHIMEVSYCVIQILMQTVRPRAVLWSV